MFNFKKLVVAQDLPRTSLTWLLVAHAMVVLPQFWIHLPIWVLPFWLVCFLWRIQIFKTRFNYPRWPLKAVLVLSLGLGMFFAYGNFLNPESGSILLVATFSLKLIESRTTRDGWVLIFLALALIAVGFLFETNIVYAVYNLLTITVITGAMFGLQNTSHKGHKPMGHVKLALKTASLLLVQALPLMIILFIVFPRLPPLWQLPSQKQSNQTKTGLSDSMSPGDFSELSQSKATAFWADFLDSLPAKKTLYWRAMTFDQFDGRTWKASSLVAYPTVPEINKQGIAVPYRVLMEPTQRNWIFALDYSPLTANSNINIRDFQAFIDGRIESVLPVMEKITYQLDSYPNALLSPSRLPSTILIQNKKLPKTGNPKAHAWAETLVKEHAGDPEAIANAIWTYFREQEFFYTLQPPTLGENSIDEFLYESRRGFCEHFSSTFAFVMRSAGIPTRVVTGFQGGEIDVPNKRVLVRQLDAHAWNEYWVEGKGWIRIDPTEAVAPNRIEMGLLGELGEEVANNLLGTDTSYGKFKNQFEKIVGIINYKWNITILGYQQNTQGAFLKGLFGDVSWVNLLIYSILIICIFFFVQMILILKPWLQKAPQHIRYFNKLVKHLSLFDPNINTTMTTLEIAQLTTLPSTLKPYLLQFNAAFDQIVYAQKPEPAAIKLLARSLNIILKTKPNRRDTGLLQ